VSDFCTIPEELSELSLICVLDLSHNAITSISLDFIKLKKLQELYLNDNNIIDIPDFTDIKSLYEVVV
jgi:Leucine-rich repeat (LRR) protein